METRHTDSKRQHAQIDSLHEFWNRGSSARPTSSPRHTGTARADEDALRLADQPEVILDTKEELNDLSPGITEVASPVGTAKDPAFHYRYRGLRLLLAAGGRLCLVPGHWTEQSRTLVVPYDANVRIQLVPENP